MATNRDFTLKRQNNGEYDVLLPTTHMGQVYTDNTLTTTLDSYLNGTFIKSSSRGAVGGVATLDSYGHVPANQLGPYLAGGLKLQGSMGGPTDLKTVGELLGSLEDIIADGGTTRENLVGVAWATAMGFALTEGTLPANTTYLINPGDEGDTVPPITLEAGDMLFVSKYELISTTHTWTLSVINNTYGVATIASPGIVTLVNPDHVNTMQDLAGDPSVITGTILSTLSTGGDSHDQLSANKIALMGHHHDGRYQPLDSDLTAIAALPKYDGNFIVSNGTTWTIESGGAARESLGLKIGTDVQAYAAGLASIAGLTTSANKMIYTTGSNAYATTDLTSFGRSLLANTSALNAQSTLGLVIDADVQAHSVGLDEIAGLSRNDGNFIVGNGSSWITKTGDAVRSSLDIYSKTDISNMLANRPTIFYDTTAGAVSGSLIIDID